jgi:ubiquinone/menaquinone biosynthesis C-methylase UbiE
MAEQQFTDYATWFSARGASAAAAFFLPYLRPGMSLLDCGCGPGTITLDFAEAMAPSQVTGIDWSDWIMDKPRAAAKERGIENMRFELADVQNLPYKDNSFDAVWASSCLQWVQDKPRAVREIYRVLKPGGVFGARDRNLDGDIFGNQNPEVRKAWRLHYRVQERVANRWGDVRFGAKLRGALVDAGFENVVSSFSYENHGGQDGGRWGADFFCNYLVADWAIEEMEKRGWATRETVAGMVAAWKEWAADPKSYYCLARGEAVGWKPK